MGSEALDTVIPSLQRSQRVASVLQGIGLATPENPLALKHIAEAGQPLFAAAAISAWRESGNPDEVIWVVCPHVKAQEIVQAELAVWARGTLSSGV